MNESAGMRIELEPQVRAAVDELAETCDVKPQRLAAMLLRLACQDERITGAVRRHFAGPVSVELFEGERT